MYHDSKFQASPDYMIPYLKKKKGKQNIKPWYVYVDDLQLILLGPNPPTSAPRGRSWEYRQVLLVI